MDSELLYLLSKSQVPIPAGKATVSGAHTLTTGITIPFDQASGSSPVTMATQGFLFGGVTFTGAPNYGLVAPVAGIYSASLNVYLQPTASFVGFSINLYCNISGVAAYFIATNLNQITEPAGNFLSSVTGLCALGAGDYVYGNFSVVSGGGTIGMPYDSRNNLCLSWVRSL